MDIHNWFMDIHNSIMDIHFWFMDIHNSVQLMPYCLINYSLMMPCGNTDLGQHWFRLRLAAWWYQVWSTLFQVIACCLMTPSHNLDQFCLELLGNYWRKDHHGVSSGWSSVWHRSNTWLSSTQYEQIPIILGVWPFWLTPFVFRSITFWWAYG